MPRAALIESPFIRFGCPMREFFEEIKRRNVFKVALVYIVAAWLTMPVIDVMFPALSRYRTGRRDRAGRD